MGDEEEGGGRGDLEQQVCLGNDEVCRREFKEERGDEGGTVSGRGERFKC